ncbi:toxin-antitoxin system HicB family antitoxin [Nonomuraea longicatena]|uniref:Toxin-antitoxin system HicB family antitoxin n=1 Tax=Nonomuraea longicatena TaxID=83682 RepID=A0ABN1QZZ5_9ACTN
MDLAPYVEYLRRELAVAAAAAGEEARAVAERLAASLDAAARLTLLEALSAATDEITRDLAPGSVDVRLRGRDPDFVVSMPMPDTTAPELPPAMTPPVTSPVASTVAPEGEEGGTSRISLRVPDHLKRRIEEAAERESLSVNAWLSRAVSAALTPDSDQSRRARVSGTSGGGKRYSGWVR